MKTCERKDKILAFSTLAILLIMLFGSSFSFCLHNITSGVISLQSTILHDNIVMDKNTSAPTLISPKNGTVFFKDDGLIFFNWTSVKDAVNYTLLVDLAKNFSTSNLIKVEGILETEYALNTSDPSYGEWYWRVCAVYSDGKKAYSDISIFYIDPKRDSIIFISIADVLIGMIPFMILIMIALILHYKEKKKQQL